MSVLVQQLNTIGVLILPQTLALVFLAITFLETGISKLLNYQNGLIYFRDHFKNSVLIKSISVLFPVIVVLEVVTGTLSVAGIIALWFGLTGFAVAAFLIGSITFLNLYFGQRIAKDYVGASGIVPYIIASLAGLMLFIM